MSDNKTFVKISNRQIFDAVTNQHEDLKALRIQFQAHIEASATSDKTLTERFDRHEEEDKTRFKWILGFFSTLVIALIGLFKWLRDLIH